MTLEEVQIQLTNLLSTASGVPSSRVWCSRAWPLPYCRALIALWLRDNYRYSHSMIGKVIGKNHSTVNHLLKMMSYVYTPDSEEMRVRPLILDGLSDFSIFGDDDFRYMIKHMH